MKNLKYEIRYEEDGYPYIHLPNPNMDVEDMFFCFEIVNYRLQGVMADKENQKLPEEALNELGLATTVIDGFSKKIASMIKETNGAMNDIDSILKPKDDSKDDD